MRQRMEGPKINMTICSRFVCECNEQLQIAIPLVVRLVGMQNRETRRNLTLDKIKIEETGGAGKSATRG